MQVSEYQIETEYDLQSFTIALIADLHGKSYKHVIDSLISYQPDYIAIVGDMINGDYDAYPLEFFSLCSHVAPTFFSLGNHERKITEEQIQSISNTNITVLDNDWVRIDTLIFGGMTSAFVTEWRNTHKTTLHYALPDFSWLDAYIAEPGFHILLDHHPENFERLTRHHPIELVLSGHAHGGQIRLGGAGLYAPHQGFLPKYTSGVYDNRLVVSRGLANNKLIPRMWNPTELVYITVHHIG